MSKHKMYALMFLLLIVSLGLIISGCGSSGGGGLSLPTEITLISINATDSTESDDASYYASINANGRYVAFTSDSDLLMDEDTNGQSDIFIYDGSTETLQLISNAADGAQGNNGSYNPSVNADGKFVAFESEASTLVTGDNNMTGDIFLRDVQAGTVKLISINAVDGTETDENSYAPSISADGKLVAFYSDSNLLVPGESDQTDIFLYDSDTDSLSFISNAADGTLPNGGSFFSSISADGKFVAFDSTASNLVATDANGFTRDVFLREIEAGTVTLISVNSVDGSEGEGSSFRSSISADGKFVAFQSNAENLVPGDTNGVFDIFVRDIANDTITLISNNMDGTESNVDSSSPSISADGRYVTFECSSNNLIDEDTNNSSDIFVYDMITKTLIIVSNAADGTQADDYSYSPAISANGKYVVFESDASELVTGDTNGKSDVFFAPNK